MYISASGVQFEMPVAPCIWIAWSMIWLSAFRHHRLHHRDPDARFLCLPSTSIALAAFSTIRRMASISQRACAMICRLPPRWAIFLPKASRAQAALDHDVERLFPPCRMVRMQ